MNAARNRWRALAGSRFGRAFTWAFVRYAYVFPFLMLLVFLPIQLGRDDPDRDSVAYYLAAQRLRAGAELYDPLPPMEPHVPDTRLYLYPPFLAAAAALLPETGYPVFARAWLIVLLAAYGFFAAALCRVALGRVTRTGTLVAAAAVAFVPGVLHALNMGQADVLVWAFVAGALAWSGLGRGAGLAAATLTKVTGLWALGAAVVRERGRVLAGAATTVFAGAALAAVVMGPAAFLAACGEWFGSVLPALGQGQFDRGPATVELFLPFGLPPLDLPELAPVNLSLSFAPIKLARALGWWEYDGGPLPDVLRMYLFAAGIIAPLAAAWWLRRREPILHYSGVLAASLLFAPVFRLNYLPLLLPAVVLVIARWSRDIGTVPPAHAARSQETGPEPPLAPAVRR